ncbi:MAG: hypothetical protein Q8L79_00445 [Methylobacter sp.]|uniref:hypothetical protein n=1 Tax=Methylobacter sp. TaxID=2051955 RepID=UPI002730B5CB|nr:hypothetical protein [Methylobacter sp.]MDP1663569.1 hypothetical protein [Methylobacter sp.]
MAKIGVFWVHNRTVIGKAGSVEAGIEGVPGIIDSHENHVDVWDINRQWLREFPCLAGVEYQEIPRGRVLFLKKENRPLVYLDKSLMAIENRLLISKFFEFEQSMALWKSDFHYATSKNELDNLFDENN